MYKFHETQSVIREEIVNKIRHLQSNLQEKQLIIREEKVELLDFTFIHINQKPLIKNLRSYSF